MKKKLIMFIFFIITISLKSQNKYNGGGMGPIYISNDDGWGFNTFEYFGAISNIGLGFQSGGICHLNSIDYKVETWVPVKKNNSIVGQELLNSYNTTDTITYIYLWKTYVYYDLLKINNPSHSGFRPFSFIISPYLSINFLQFGGSHILFSNYEMGIKIQSSLFYFYIGVEGSTYKSNYDFFRDENKKDDYDIDGKIKEYSNKDASYNIFRKANPLDFIVRIGVNIRGITWDENK
jgi:hypothetical protein